MAIWLSPRVYWPCWLAAMGLQTATVTRIGPLTIHTTFVTGMLNKLAQLAAQWIFLTHDLRHDGAKLNELRKERSLVGRRARLISGIWLFYLPGALSGTWASLHWQLRSLYRACVILLFSVLVDQVRPLALEEEREQVEP